MKYIKLVLSIFLLTLIVSCSDENAIGNDCEVKKNADLLTRSIAEDTTWFCHNKCCLYGDNGLLDTVPSPWSSPTVGEIPYTVRMDVKKSDGWDILYSTVHIYGYQKPYNYHWSGQGVNYILFYNKKSGILKGFCYLKNVDLNNNGIWRLSVNDSTRLFNFSGDVAIPYNGPKKSEIFTSNVTDYGVTRGFATDWNCFMVELAYDADSPNQMLNVSGYSMNTTTYNFVDTATIYSSGSIVTSTHGENGMLKSLSSAAGEGAKSLIIKYVSSAYKSTIASIASKGISSIVSYGLNKLFPSLFGSTRTTVDDLHVTSNGTGKISGTSVQPVSGNVKPLSGVALNGLDQALGVWNLREAPIYWMDPASELSKVGTQIGANIYYYKVNVSSTYELLINPAESNYTSSSAMIALNTGLSSDVYYLSDGGVNRIYDTNTYDYPSTFMVYASNLLPNSTLGYNSPAFNWAYANKPIWGDVRVCISTITSSYGINNYSCKKYIPTHRFKSNSARPYSWTINELKGKGYIR